MGVQEGGGGFLFGGGGGAGMNHNARVGRGGGPNPLIPTSVPAIHEFWLLRKHCGPTHEVVQNYSILRTFPRRKRVTVAGDRPSVCGQVWALVCRRPAIGMPVVGRRVRLLVQAVASPSGASPFPTNTTYAPPHRPSGNRRWHCRCRRGRQLPIACPLALPCDEGHPAHVPWIGVAEANSGWTGGAPEDDWMTMGV